MRAHPFFHAALKELTSTGFLSNRARQMFASVWLNDLDLNWRSGAQLFEQHLIDYDVYSNFGNWMYLAGVGVDPRGRRYFDIDKQLHTYDPNGEYLNQFVNWSPEL
jgi:deoxyribodipyrimidine photo-lyase